MPTPPDFTNGTPLDASSLNAVGLWLIKSQTIGNGVTTQQVTSCFSADYQDYVVTVSGGTATTNTILSFRCGTQASGYRYSYLYTSYTSSPLAVGTVSDAAILYVGFANTTGLNAIINVSSPFLPQPTLIAGDGGSIGNFAGRVTGFEPGNGSFTGLTLVLGAGTMTGGTIRVYGYRK
jgi:hypothetical protein